MSITDSISELSTSFSRAARWRRMEDDGRVVSDEVDALLADAMNEVRESRDRSAVRMLLRTANRWMNESRWAWCEQLLLRADPSVLETTASLGVLAAVEPVRDRTLEARTDFIRRLRSHLFETRSAADAEALMQGLR